MKVNNTGLDLIKRFEGFSSKPYICPAGVPSIGYGATYYEDRKRVTMSDPTITKERGEQLLRNLVDDFAMHVERMIKVPVTENQFAALVSLAFNIGLGNFSRSTVLRKLNTFDYDGAANNFWQWRKGGGKVLQGLVNRRAAEKELFLT